MPEEHQLPSAQLLPTDHNIETFLRFRISILEAKIARDSLNERFGERVDVDHFAWLRQKQELEQLRINVIILSGISAGCIFTILWHVLAP